LLIAGFESHECLRLSDGFVGYSIVSDEDVMIDALFHVIGHLVSNGIEKYPFRFTSMGVPEMIVLQNFEAKSCPGLSCEKRKY
jgi:hypothetical protein